MKDFISTVPYEWLEKEKQWKSKEIIVLENKHYIWDAQEENCASPEYELFYTTTIAPGDEQKSSTIDKEGGSNKPEIGRQDHKCDITKKCRYGCDHACEKNRIVFITDIDPGPES